MPACDGALGRRAGLYVKAGTTDVGDTAWNALNVTTKRLLMDNAGWKEVCAVDVDVDSAKDKIDTSDRCSGDFKSFVPGQQEGTISFKAFKRKPIVTGDWLDLLRDAFQTNDSISVMMLDAKRSIDGADGVIGNYNVFNMSESQPLQGAIEVNFELAVSGCTTFSPPVQAVTRPAAAT